MDRIELQKALKATAHFLLEQKQLRGSGPPKERTLILPDGARLTIIDNGYYSSGSYEILEVQSTKPTPETSLVTRLRVSPDFSYPVSLSLTLTNLPTRFDGEIKFGYKPGMLSVKGNELITLELVNPNSPAETKLPRHRVSFIDMSVFVPLKEGILDCWGKLTPAVIPGYNNL